jgi:hypothetical protein
VAFSALLPLVAQRRCIEVMHTKFHRKCPRNMEITDRNFVTLLHESVTQSIDFHIQHNSEFRTRIETAGFDFRVFIERLSSESGFWNVRGILF